MALISCPECSTSVSERASSCPKCGCPIAQQSPTITPPPAPMTAPAGPVVVTKSRGVHIILGLLFGWLALHNFYAGYNTRGGVKFALVFICFVLDASTGFRTGFGLVAAVIMTCWALVEIIVISKDASGQRMT